MELEDILYLENNIVIVISGFDKKNDLAVSYGLMYNKRTGKVNQKVIALSEIEVESKRRSGSFGIKTSQNGRFLLIYHYAKLKKSGKQQLSITVYDSDLELVKEFEREFDLDDRDRAVYGLSKFMIDNEGNIFYFKTDGSQAESEGMYIVSHLFMEDYVEKELEVELVETEDGMYNSVSGLTIMSDGKFVYLGGYYMKLKSGIVFASGLGVDGTFYSKIDPIKNEVLAQSKSPFDDELKRQILSERKVKKGKKIPNTFRIKDMILTEEGEMVIVSEDYIFSQQQTTGMITTTHIYGSMIVTKVSNEGEIEWNKAIVKTQLYTDVKPVLGVGGGALTAFVSFSITKDETIYYSYLMGVGEDDLYFIYNDHEANFQLPPEKHKKLTKPKKGVPAVVTISFDTGEMTKEPGYNVLSEDVILRPQLSRQVSGNEVLVYASRKKTDKIGRIRFD